MNADPSFRDDYWGYTSSKIFAECNNDTRCRNVIDSQDFDLSASTWNNHLLIATSNLFRNLSAASNSDKRNQVSLIYNTSFKKRESCKVLQDISAMTLVPSPKIVRIASFDLCLSDNED